jgi:hypothetical protein
MGWKEVSMMRWEEFGRKKKKKDSGKIDVKC